MSERVFCIEVNDGDCYGCFDNVSAFSEEEAIEIVYSSCDSDEVEILSVEEVSE